MTHHDLCKLTGSLAGDNVRFFGPLKAEISSLREQLTCQEVCIIGLLAELKRDRQTRIYQSEGREN